MGSDAPLPAPVVNNIVASSCSWDSAYYPEDGFATRWTRGEKEWLAEHNRKAREFCPEINVKPTP